MQCPNCGKEGRIGVRCGNIDTFTCTTCGQGYKRGVPGTPARHIGAIFDLDCVLDEMVIMIGKRKLVLTPVASRPG
jgi:hypothetical protein